VWPRRCDQWARARRPGPQGRVRFRSSSGSISARAGSRHEPLAIHDDGCCGHRVPLLRCEDAETYERSGTRELCGRAEARPGLLPFGPIEDVERHRRVGGVAQASGVHPVLPGRALPPGRRPDSTSPVRALIRRCRRQQGRARIDLGRLDHCMQNRDAWLSGTRSEVRGQAVQVVPDESSCVRSPGPRRSRACMTCRFTSAP
jgi:hypothetical protein